MTQNNQPEGTKNDQGLPDLSLIPPFALEEMAYVLMRGAKKYGEGNWEKGLHYRRILSAIGRHLRKYERGETLDPDTGRSHMANVMCNAAFLLYFEKVKPELDNRIKYDIKD